MVNRVDTKLDNGSDMPGTADGRGAGHRLASLLSTWLSTRLASQA